MNRKNTYKDLDKWRASCNRGRKANYAKGRFNEGNRRKWTIAEMERVEKHDIPDRQLAEELKTTVQAIQLKRYRIRKEQK